MWGGGAICTLGSAGSESCLAMAEYSERTVRRPVSNEVMSVKCSWRSEHDLIKKVFFFSFFSHSFWGIPTSKNNGHSWPSVLHVQQNGPTPDRHDFEKKGKKKMNDGGLVTLFLLSQSLFFFVFFPFLFLTDEPWPIESVFSGFRPPLTLYILEQ